MTFAQLDALATAPSISEEVYARYLSHLEFRELGDHVSERCTCVDNTESLFCYAPVHFKPWWSR